jgi:hypothetical protein
MDRLVLICPSSRKGAENMLYWETMEEADYMQKAFVLYFMSEKKTNLDELNQLLVEGWKVASQSPMSNSNLNSSFSLVILEK